MNDQLFIIQCKDPSCDLRTSTLTRPENATCPRCHGSVELFTFQQEVCKCDPIPKSIQSIELTVLLDNIRSAYNVGSIFRTADGAGVNKIILAGTTPTPDHEGIRKTGLGSEWSVDWEYRSNGLKTAKEYQDLGYLLLALETSVHPTPLFELHLPAGINKVLLIVGNEKTGIDPEILARADQTISLPMLGYKRSLNVATAAGIALYYVRFFFSHS